MRPPAHIIAKLAYVVVMLAVAGAGTLNGALRLTPDAKLFGVEVGAERPPLAWRAWRDETFQRAFLAWYEQRWGLRGYAVRSDNSLVMALFGQPRSAESVVVGERGVLFSREDVELVNRSDPPDAARAIAHKLASVRARLRARGVVLVPVVIPAKTSLHRDAVPLAWRRRGVFGASDENIYGAFVATLRAEGAPFVDARAMLEKRPGAFPRTGRHWTAAAGCLTLDAVFALARAEMPELGDEHLDCATTTLQDPSIDEEPFDLFRLLNTWDRKPADVTVARLSGLRAGATLRVPTLFVGSSFLWQFVHVARALDVAKPSLFYYYDKSVLDTEALTFTKKVEPFTDAWRDDTFSKRLFVLGILETFIPEDGRVFLEELDRELSR
ncbi:MAG: hypothetical protein KC657_24745 [Myxococcales bacterium]|nr:hypothetical protein [Myxococcales bacterium]